MANFDIIVIENERQKRRPSSSNTFDFSSIKVGASALELKETTGHFDFSAKKLTNIATPAASTDASTKDYVDSRIEFNASSNWVALDGNGAVETVEYNEKVWLFSQGLAQGLVMQLKVPQSYVAGKQLNFYGGFYSPSTSNNFRFQVVATLIRKNTDAVTSTTNQNTANSGDITNSVANQHRELNIALSNGSGQINSVAIGAGDLIKLTLTRATPGGTDDTADVRFLPSTTEFRFS